MEHKLREAVGKRLKGERIRLGLSQEYMAEKADVSLTFYGDIERGKKGMSAETLYKLKANLGISVDYLLAGDISTNANATFSKLQTISPQKAKRFEDMIRIFLELCEL